MSKSDESQDDLAVKIIDTALYILQTRQFTVSQQSILTHFLEDKVGVEQDRAQEVLHQELHPKHRNVLSFVEKKGLKVPCLRRLLLHN
jgi:hypothetical protein